MQTAANSPEQIREGLEAGAYYYLTKPYRRDNLLAIVHAALSDAEARHTLSRQLHQHVNSLQFLEQAEFSIRTIYEAGQLASFIAQACPNPDQAVIGISELLVNGVEHGNLGLSYGKDPPQARRLLASRSRPPCRPPGKSQQTRSIELSALQRQNHLAHQRPGQWVQLAEFP
jgi:hypothetical protein